MLYNFFFVSNALISFMEMAVRELKKNLEKKINFDIFKLKIKVFSKPPLLRFSVKKFESNARFSHWSIYITPESGSNYRNPRENEQINKSRVFF